MKNRHRHLHGALAATLTLLISPGAPADGANDHHAHQHEVLPSTEPVPGESIYQLKAILTDQNNKQASLESLRGHPVLITMFYTSCQGVCPMLAFALKRAEAALTPQERRRLRIVMVSFDPQRDTPQALRKFAELHKIDGQRWLLARTADNAVREIAAALGVRYRPLPAGAYSHSASVFLLDAQGVIRARTDNLQALDPEFMQTLRAELNPQRQ